MFRSTLLGGCFSFQYIYSCMAQDSIAFQAITLLSIFTFTQHFIACWFTIEYSLCLAWCDVADHISIFLIDPPPHFGAWIQVSPTENSSWWWVFREQLNIQVSTTVDECLLDRSRQLAMLYSLIDCFLQIEIFNSPNHRLILLVIQLTLLATERTELQKDFVSCEMYDSTSGTPTIVHLPHARQ